MPVSESRVVILTDYPNKGSQLVLPADQPLKSETTTTVACDSPTCKNTVSWVQETDGDKPENFPDEAARLLVITHFDGRRAAYCSWDCLRRAMKDYVPPLSPREKAEIERNNKKIEEVKQAPDTTKIHLVPPFNPAAIDPSIPAPTDYTPLENTAAAVGPVNGYGAPIQSSGIQTTETGQ